MHARVSVGLAGVLCLLCSASVFGEVFVKNIPLTGATAYDPPPHFAGQEGAVMGGTTGSIVPESGIIKHNAAIAAMAPASLGWARVGLRVTDGINSAKFSVGHSGLYRLVLRGTLDGYVMEGSLPSGLPGAGKTTGCLDIGALLRGEFSNDYSVNRLHDVELGLTDFLSEIAWESVKNVVSYWTGSDVDSVIELIGVLELAGSTKQWSNEQFEIDSVNYLEANKDYSWIFYVQSIQASAQLLGGVGVAHYEMEVTGLSAELYYVGDDYYHVVRASHGANGRISPSGDVHVKNANSITMYATPDFGYVVDRWYVDGQDVGVGIPSLMIQSVTSNRDVLVTFKEDTLTSQLLVAGSSNPGTYETTIAPGQGQYFDIPILNAGDSSMQVDCTKSGTAAGWTSLSSSSFTLGPQESANHQITISVPSNASSGTYSVTIAYNGVELPISIEVARLGEPWQESLQTNGVWIDGSSTFVTYNFDNQSYETFSISGKYQTHAQTYLDLTKSQYINAGAFNLYVQVQNLNAGNNNLEVYVNNKKIGTITQSDVKQGDTKGWNFYNIGWDKLIEVRNVVDFRLNPYNSSDETNRWKIWDNVSLYTTSTVSAWSAADDVSIPYNVWRAIKDGYMASARVYADVTQITRTGTVYLYNNGKQVDSTPVSSTGRKYWWISASELDKDSNHFVLKGDPSSQPRVQVSNIELVIMLTDADPVLEITKELSSNEVQVGQQVTVTVRIRNTRQDSATGYDTYLSDSLPNGFTLISGSLNKNIGNFRYEDEKTNIYTIRADQAGRYVLPPAKVNYENLYGDAMVNQSSYVELSVMEHFEFGESYTTTAYGDWADWGEGWRFLYNVVTSDVVHNGPTFIGGLVGDPGVQCIKVKMDNPGDASGLSGSIWLYGVDGEWDMGTYGPGPPLSCGQAWGNITGRFTPSAYPDGTQVVLDMSVSVAGQFSGDEEYYSFRILIGESVIAEILPGDTNTSVVVTAGEELTYEMYAMANDFEPNPFQTSYDRLFTFALVVTAFEFQESYTTTAYGDWADRLKVPPYESIEIPYVVHNGPAYVGGLVGNPNYDGYQYIEVKMENPGDASGLSGSIWLYGVDGEWDWGWNWPYPPLSCGQAWGNITGRFTPSAYPAGTQVVLDMSVSVAGQFSGDEEYYSFRILIGGSVIAEILPGDTNTSVVVTAGEELTYEMYAMANDFEPNPLQTSYDRLFTFELVVTASE